MNAEQERLYELFEEVDQICRKHGIVYYIDGGISLGAIRGGGFMPWDDDIDISITRENWHKLVEAMKTDLPPDRLFVCTENDDLYRNPIGRYVDRRTTAMMKSQLLSAKACGLMVEFFIFDLMPKGEEAKKRHRMLVKTYCELLAPYAVANRNILYENADFSYDNYTGYLKRAEKEGMNNILAELYHEITSVPEEEGDAWYMVWARMNRQYPKEMYGKPRYVKFERGMFPTSEKQEHIERLVYGNSWMYIPYVNEQRAHDATDSEIEIPYQEIVDIYMPFLDKDKLYNAFLNRKRVKVDSLETWSNFKKERELLWFGVLGKPIREKCDSSAADLRKALDAGDYKTVYAGIKDFLYVQRRFHVKINGLMLPVSDEFLSVVFDYHIRTGCYYSMSSMVKVRRDKGGEISGCLKASLEEFDYCRALSVAVYDDRDIEKVEILIGEHAEYADRIDTVRAKLWVMSKRACSEKDYRALLDAAEAAEHDFPDDGEIIRFTAQALFLLGRKDEAKEKYTEAVKKSRNGFVWHEAEVNSGIDAYGLMGEASEGEDAVEDEDFDDQEEDQEAGQGDDEDDEQEDEESVPEGSDPDNLTFRMKRLKELLFEIDDICRANGLKYSLTQRFAITMQEENKFPDEFNNICIAMTLGDLERLEHIVNDEGDGSRIIENIHNNPNADSLAVRYVDNGTTLLDFSDYDRHKYHGLYIDIRPIKQYDPEHMERRTYNFYKGLWTSCCKDRNKERSALKSFAVNAVRSFMGDKGLAERYYQADRDVSLVDSWEDIEKAPAIKCGAFSIRKKSYYRVSRFRDFNLERGWKVEDRMAEGHPVMYCNQFYGRHVRGGAHSIQWVLDNQMLSPEPYSELITGDLEKKLNEVRMLRDKYKQISAPMAGYEETIDSAWNVYLMAKDVLLYEKHADEVLYSEIQDALDQKDKEKFVSLMEDYFTYLINWRITGTPVIQIPKLRQFILDAIEAFYPDLAIPADALEANDIDKLIVAHSFPYLDDSRQLARLIKAAGTGNWDLIDRKDRKEGEAPFRDADMSALDGLLSEHIK